MLYFLSEIKKKQQTPMKDRVKKTASIKDSLDLEISQT